MSLNFWARSAVFLYICDSKTYELKSLPYYTMKRQTPLLLTLAMAGLSAGSAFAAPLTPDEAKDAAGEFLSSNSSLRRAAPAVRGELTLAYTAASTQGNSFYIFNSPDGGFTIVSADDRLPVVLGFSRNGSFDAEKIPSNVAWWLSEYNKEIEGFLARDPQTEAPVVRHADSMGREPIGPLVKTLWDQGAPFNDQCPVDQGGRAVTGCVATAMAQVMKFHEWPEKATGSRGGFTFEGTVFQWDDMIDNYSDGYSSTQANAVATLMRQCGASVDMQYSSYASGAYSNDVPVALYTYFGYDRGMRQEYRDYYSQRIWNQMVYDELSQNRPLYYSGQSDQGGHAFVCDGYLSDEMFHFNWGWNGYQDGYFRLSALNPATGGAGSSGGGYNASQSILLGVKKAENPNAPLQQLLLATGDFVNTSGNTFAIQNGQDGQNLIYNPLAYSIVFTYGLKITNDANADDVRYVKSSSTTSLQPYYGINEANFTIPSLPDGNYKIRPAFLTNSNEWMEVMVPYGHQSYVELAVKGGKQTMTNAGADAETRSHLIISDLEYVEPIYAGDMGAFRLSAVNVANGDFYSNLIVGLYSDDDFGPYYEMGNMANVPGNASADISVHTDAPIEEGDYHLYVLDNTGINELIEPIAIQVKKRPDVAGLTAPAGNVEFSLIQPSFHISGEECGVSITASNTSKSDAAVKMQVRLVKASDFSQVMRFDASYDFKAEQKVVLNFAPQPLEVPAGNYYWIAYDDKGNTLSAPQPLKVYGKEFTLDGVTYRPLDDKTARVVGVDDNEANHSVTVAANPNGFQTVELAQSVFTFNRNARYVTLPEGIKEIPAGAFYSAGNLQFLTMQSQTPPVLNKEAFSDQLASEVVISGPQGGFTNAYHQDEAWAPFQMSSWEIDAQSDIEFLNMWGGANFPNPYFVAYNEKQLLRIEFPYFHAPVVTTEINGQTATVSYDSPWYIYLPALNGASGKVKLTLVDDASVDGVGDDAAPVDVYSADGTLVLRQALPADIKVLPAGLYIAGGRKVIVK